MNMKMSAVSIVIVLILAGTVSARDMIKPYRCPLCSGLMNYDVTGMWD